MYFLFFPAFISRRIRGLGESLDVGLIVQNGL